MPLVLTTASTVQCGPTVVGPPPNHGGSVNTASNSKLTVDGSPVLLASSIQGKSVSGCATPNDSSKSLVTCTLVASLSAGQATKLTAGGAAVILETLAGSTNGNPPGTLPASADQSKLASQ